MLLLPLVLSAASALCAAGTKVALGNQNRIHIQPSFAIKNGPKYGLVQGPGRRGVHMLKHNRIFSPCTVNTMVEGFRHTLLVLERYQLPANLMHGNRISVTFGTKEERGGGVKGLESTSTGLFSPPSPVLRRFRCSGCESESLDSAAVL